VLDEIEPREMAQRLRMVGEIKEEQVKLWDIPLPTLTYKIVSSTSNKSSGLIHTSHEIYVKETLSINFLFGCGVVS